MKPLYVDKKLTPIDHASFIELQKDPEYCLIKKTFVSCIRDKKTDEFEVITVWVGADKDRTKTSFKPFGTRVFFKGCTADLASFELKARDEKEALELHDKTCKRVSIGVFPIIKDQDDEEDLLNEEVLKPVEKTSTSRQVK